MRYYLIRFGDESNFLELVNRDELENIYKSAEEFDGFTGITFKMPIDDASYVSIKNKILKWEKEKLPH